GCPGRRSSSPGTWRAAPTPRRRRSYRSRPRPPATHHRPSVPARAPDRRSAGRGPSDRRRVRPVPPSATVLAPMGPQLLRLLPALLAVRRGVVVPVDGIIEALGRDEPPTKARENVSSLVSRLRATLGQAAVETVGEGYRLAVGSAVTVDLEDAEALVEEAEA